MTMSASSLRLNLRRVVGLAVLVAALGAPAAALGDHTVTVTVCEPSSANHALSPTAFGGAPLQFQSFCPGGPLNAALGGPYAPGAGGGYQAYAPPGTSFKSVILDTDTTVTSGPDGSQFILDGINTSNQFGQIYACGVAPSACPSGSINLQAARLLEFRVLLYCASSGGCRPIFGPGFHIYAGQLVIQDENPPRIVSKAGPVWSPGIWHHASDLLDGVIGNGAEGIQSVTATLDATPTTITTACDNSQLRVCPDATPNNALAAATDGTHHLTITATTAAGITTTLYDDPKYSVDSTPPTPALGVTLDPPGERYAPAASRTLSWTNPGGQVSPITHAVVHVCRVDTGQCRDQTADSTNVQQATITPWGGGGAYRLSVVLQDQAGNINPAAQSAPVLLRYDQRPYSVFAVSTRGLIARSCHRAKRPPRHARRATLAKARHHKRPTRRLVCRVRLRHPRHNLRVRNGHHAAILGVLTDATGLPLANQPIAVSQQLRGPGQVFSAVATTTTDANGFMRFVAAPGPSRTLSFAFAGNDGIKAAVSNVNLRVPAFSTFHVEPQVAHVGQRIVFAGRLLGGHIPKAGKSLLIEGLDRGRLVPVSRGLRTDRRGHWRFAYVFHNQTGAAYTYAFHLAIPFDSVYPYLPAATHALPVTILNP